MSFFFTSLKCSTVNNQFILDFKRIKKIVFLFFHSCFLKDRFKCIRLSQTYTQDPVYIQCIVVRTTLMMWAQHFCFALRIILAF